MAAGRPDATDAGASPSAPQSTPGTPSPGSTGANGAVNDFTALDDDVNTTARLASEANAGDLLVSQGAAVGAGLETSPWNGGRLRSAVARGRSLSISLNTVAFGMRGHEGAS
jgi:class 3 adenylate cyclase